MGKTLGNKKPRTKSVTEGRAPEHVRTGSLVAPSGPLVKTPTLVVRVPAESAEQVRQLRDRGQVLDESAFHGDDTTDTSKKHIRRKANGPGKKPKVFVDSPQDMMRLIESISGQEERRTEQKLQRQIDLQSILAQKETQRSERKEKSTKKSRKLAVAQKKSELLRQQKLKRASSS